MGNDNTRPGTGVPRYAGSGALVPPAWDPGSFMAPGNVWEPQQLVDLWGGRSAPFYGRI